MTEEKEVTTEEELELTPENIDFAEEEPYKTEKEMNIATPVLGSVTETKPHKKKSPQFGWDGMKMWWAVMLIYMFIFTYIGYIAFWPMSFNDPDNTVKKYLTILKQYQAENPKVEDDTLNLAMEELMKKAENSANDLQQLASQSFNIVLGAFLAFLSATVTTIFQRVGRNKEPSPETSA